MPLLSSADPRPPRLWPWLLLCAAAAALADFGNLHALHQVDSLTPILVSLQHWTPFFWCQDRIGMLVPLLALPLRHPLVNLLFQEGIYLFAGLAAMFLLARYLLRDRTYPIVGAIMAAAFMALVPAWFRFEFFNTTFYGVWLALGLGGLVLAEPRSDGSFSAGRQGAALVLLLLAHWVYIGTALVLGPLVLLRAWLVDGERFRGGWKHVCSTEAGRASLLLAGALAGGSLLMLLSPNHGNYAGTALPVEWWQTGCALAANTWQALAPQIWPGCLLALLAGGLVVGAMRRWPEGSGRSVRAGAAAALAAGVYGVFVASRLWVAWNDCHPRYGLPSMFLLQGGLVAAGVAPLVARLRPAVLRELSMLMVPGLLAAVLMGYGLPSAAGVRADLDRTLGDCTEDILAAGCTHLAGHPYTAWPRVFHVNLVRYERGEREPFWGISYRTEATRPFWRDMPRERIRVAVMNGDEDAAEWLEKCGLGQLTEIKQRTTIRVLGWPPAHGTRQGIASTWRVRNSESRAALTPARLHPAGRP